MVGSVGQGVWRQVGKFAGWLVSSYTGRLVGR